MKFIVTGGAGFIGSHTVENLLLNKHKVIVVDNLSTGQIKNLPDHDGLTFLQKDINTCKPSDFSDGIDGIVHLSAVPSVQDSWNKAFSTHQDNLTSTLSVLELCHHCGIKRIVFASSAAVYGNIQKASINEETSTSPISPYGLHKLFSEHYLSLFSKKLHLSVVALRFFNVFGPRQNPDSQYSGVISKFLNAMKNNKPITIYGTGEQSRDFVFVKDIAEMCSKALLQPLAESFVTVNIGTGRAVSVNQLVESLKSEFPYWNAGAVHLSAQEGDILHSRADISKARLFFDFKPKYDLETGLASLVRA